MLTFLGFLFIALMLREVGVKLNTIIDQGVNMAGEMQALRDAVAEQGTRIAGAVEKIDGAVAVMVESGGTLQELADKILESIGNAEELTAIAAEIRARGESIGAAGESLGAASDALSAKETEVDPTPDEE